jgi:hypothetical protein
MTTKINQEDVEEYMKLSDSINDGIDRIKVLKEKFEEDDEDVDTRGNDRRPFFSKNHEKKAEVRKNLYRFEENSKKIIGEMYKGVLINKKLTIRNGEVHYFRRRWTPNLDNIINTLNENKIEVITKIGTQNWKIIEFIIEKNKEIREKASKLDVSSKLELKKPVKIFWIDDYYERVRGYTEEIHYVEITDNGLYLKNKEESTVQISWKDYRKFLNLKFKNEMEKLVEEFEEKVNKVYNEVQKINEELEVKGGKYLIVSALRCQ